MNKARTRRRAGARGQVKQAGPTLELSVLQQFRVIFGSARRHDKYVRRISAVPGSLLWALSEIGRDAGMSIGMLSRQMALHQTTASNLVKALVKQGLVERVRSSEDRRVVRLTVGVRGRRVLNRAPQPHAGLLADALQRLDRRQLISLRQGLAVIVTEMRRASLKAAGETLLGE